MFNRKTWYANYRARNRKKLADKQKEYVSKNRTIVNTRHRNHWKRKRLFVLEHYGNKCVCCGETNYEFLTLDHINNDGNRHRKEIGYNGKSIITWIFRNNFPKQIQILCMNCNWAKRYGICPHKLRI